MNSARDKVRNLLIGSVAGCLSVASLVFRARLEPTLRNWRIILYEYSFILFASIALFYLYKGLADRLRLGSTLRQPGLLLLFIAVNGWFTYKLGMCQFGAFDDSYLSNLGLHYLKGFRPIIDYPSPMPPLFLAGVRIAVFMFGFRWASFPILFALFSAVTSVWIFTLLRQLRLPRHWSLLTTIAVALSTAIVSPVWWYNNTTSVSVALLFLSVLVCLRDAALPFSWISLSVSLGMVIAAKPNAALMCLAPLVLVFKSRQSQWFRAIWVASGAILFFLLMCWIAEISPIGLFHSYIEISKSRGNPLKFYGMRDYKNLEELFVISQIIFVSVCFAKVFISALKSRRPRWRPLAISMLATVTSVEMSITNNEMKVTDLFVVLVAAILVSFESSNKCGAVNLNSKSELAALLALFIIWSGFFGIIHLRVLSSGEGLFYQPLPTEKIESGFLAGLDAGPKLLSVQKEVSNVLASYPSQKVFFGPRMEFEYAVFNRGVIPGLPVEWDVGTAYSPRREPELLRNFIKQDPDLLIFLKDDYTRMGLVARYITTTTRYCRLDDFDNLTVYVPSQRAQKRRNICNQLNSILRR